MTKISATLRRQVSERASGLCEYCQTAEINVIEMEIDHIIPESAGGQTTLDNLCLACISCNGFKGAFELGTDPDTETTVPLFNPRDQQWDQHFEWSSSGTHLLGKTATGRATIDRLNINRPAAVRTRERWVAVGWHPPK